MPGFRVIVAAALLAASSVLIVSASGRMALYGVIDRVVFEPNDQAPTRLQLWGAFAYGDLTPQSGAAIGRPSVARRGYLYFTLPNDEALTRATLAEWRDLKAVAGTGQAVSFGLWGYVTTFTDLDPGRSAGEPLTRTIVTGQRASAGPAANLHIRAAGEPVSAPVVYTPNTGVVKLSENGSRADVVELLKGVPAAAAAR